MASPIVMLARCDDTRRIIIVRWCLRQQHPQLLPRETRRRHLHKINQTARPQIIRQAAAHQQLRIQVYHPPQRAVILVDRDSGCGG